MLCNCISQVLKCLPEAVLNTLHTLTLHVNIDGIPLFNSSSVSLWPILGKVSELNCDPFVIALYSGANKPKSATEFLDDFIKEMKSIELNGFLWCGRQYIIILDAVICDAPAHAFIKCIKGHSGYSSCERCINEGEYIEGRMTFQQLDAKLRTNEDFHNMTGEDHHTGISPFTELLTIGCVTNFPLDYMHLVCLGVVCHTVMLWMSGPLSCQMSGTQVRHVSGELPRFRNHLPKAFSG